ncbi:MAG TPA: adenosylcobalamin-dependent ribonucleoside-diphosphate reductase [Methanomicrobiales archaeon]|jgi:ribonucleoside-diphosphate reductase alpha chain|nr:adenosylcobalamin-dependent ribonucleoside-diphosphate reductase [Methanomicrobiales archaeon]
MPLTEPAEVLLRARYVNPGESPAQVFPRVAAAVDTAKAGEFRRVMEELLFLPNSPTLMNAGTNIGQLSACFVLPVEDSIESIFRTLGHMALIHKSGGGTGFSFSRIRPKGDMVNGTAGIASGPVSFMEVFDKATEAVKQGGRRRGANMGVLTCHHPDIREFVASKKGGGLRNFNISVGFDAGFFDALRTGKEIPLVNPRDGSVQGQLPARDLWEEIAGNAWSTGDPGVLFMDEINRLSTLPGLGSIEATNPCGEQPLLPYESCNLGSINLARCVKRRELDEGMLTGLVRTGVDFLDAIIEVNRFPIPEIQEMNLRTRKIGLGIMGFADALILLGIPYESDEALRFGERVMALIQEVGHERSRELGAEKGSFPAIGKSTYKGEMRNSTVTTIAPTGSLHIIADTSSGIEPLFALAFQRQMAGRTVNMVNRLFVQAVSRLPRSADLIHRALVEGSVKDLPIPDELKELFKTAPEISPGHHVRVQAAFQKHVDNAVSKTVNLPENATPGDISRIYELARSLGCKGITVYRYNSKPDQVLSRGCEVCRVD